MKRKGDREQVNSIELLKDVNDGELNALKTRYSTKEFDEECGLREKGFTKIKTY
ncbi:MAG: hypothetical protein R3Y67_10130 [Eubacteriales bacterium]